MRESRLKSGDSRGCNSPHCQLSSRMEPLSIRKGGVCGVFLDPPYLNSVRAADLYAEDDGDVANAVRRWAIEAGDDESIRIVLAGYDAEHSEEMEAAGWRSVEWYLGGFLKGGMANTGSQGTSQGEERLWLSPHCLTPKDDRQMGLFA